MNDVALHATIRDAAAAGRVTVEVNYARANRNGAPGYRTTDIVVPWFVCIVLSIYVGASYGIAAGIALFIVLAGLIVVALRPYNRRRAEERYRRMGLAQLDHWEALWRLGGLALRRPGDDNHLISSPEGDWRAAAHMLAGAAR